MMTNDNDDDFVKIFEICLEYFKIKLILRNSFKYIS